MNRIEGFLKTFLLENHKHDLEAILASDDDRRHYCLRVNGTTLFDASVEFGESLLYNPLKTLDSMNTSVALALRDALDDCSVGDKYNLKEKVHLRLVNLPQFIQTATLPKCKQVSRFQAITGTVLRIKGMKVLEHSRDYLCATCGYSFTIRADLVMFCMLTKPTTCPNPIGCRGSKFMPSSKETDLSKCSDYQEVLIQEKANNLVLRNVPGSMWVVLEDDLVGCCKPGQEVVVSGILSARQHKFIRGQRPDVNFVFHAHNVEVAEEQYASQDVTAEVKKEFKEFWDEHRDCPLIGRDLILASVCPQVYGLYLVKLAVALVLAGGVRHCDTSGTRIRGESHLLLVGDPGTAKSQFLKYAAKMSARSVLTTGIGSTSAGLTAAAIKDGGEWQLEAGALVLADGGICCIDEFNSIREHDRGSIHEAMEQQTISVAKAGLVTKLSTRCSVLAATNPKGSCSADGELDVNTGIASPLLSRFDLVLVLKDSHNQDWDRLVSKFILRGQNPLEEREDTGYWSISRMRSYFLTIKTLTPRLTEDAQRVLQEYYRCQRSVAQRDAARTTLRLLESLVRLSQGHARLMFREEVGVQDAVVAVALMEVSMQSSALVENVDALHTGFATDPEKEYRNQAKVILTRLGLLDILDEELRHCSRKSYPFHRSSDHSQLSLQDRSCNEHIRAAEKLNLSSNDDFQDQCVNTAGRISDTSQKSNTGQLKSHHDEATKRARNLGISRMAACAESHNSRKGSKSAKEKHQSGSKKARHSVVSSDEDRLEGLNSECSTSLHNSLHEHCIALKTKRRTSEAHQAEEASEEGVPFARNTSDVSPKSDVHQSVDIAKLLKTFVRKPKNQASAHERRPFLGANSHAEDNLHRAVHSSEQVAEHPATSSGDSSEGDKLTPSHENRIQPSQQSVTDCTLQNTSGDVSVLKEQDCASSEKASKQRPTTSFSSAQEKLKRFALVKTCQTSPHSTTLKAVANGTVLISSSSTNTTSPSENASSCVYNTLSFLNQSKPSMQEVTATHTLGIVNDDELGLNDDDWMFDRVPCDKRRRTNN
nr:DNA helicase MCM9-like isoform X1 [Dermacentor andersoni]